MRAVIFLIKIIFIFEIPSGTIYASDILVTTFT